MATNYIVRAVFNGTSLRVPVSARNAAIAADKARNMRQTRGASCYIVIDRRTQQPVFTAVNRGR